MPKAKSDVTTLDLFDEAAAPKPAAKRRVGRDPEKKRAWKRAAYNRVKDDPAFREQHRERLRGWWARNKEQATKRRRDRLASDPNLAERQRAQRALYRAANKEKVRAYQQQHYYKDIAKSRAKALKAAKRYIERDLGRNAVNAARLRARKADLEFDLTTEWARDRWTGACEVTGIAFERGARHFGALSPSIDRIDNAKGYIRDNCRFVLWAINRFKGPDTDETMLTIARALVAKADATKNGE